MLVIVRTPSSNITGDEILNYLRNKIATWWLPDAIEFLDELPHTGTGKVYKLKLREIFADYKLPEWTKNAMMSEKLSVSNC